MEQLDIFNHKTMVLAGLSFEMPEPGYHCWYETLEDCRICSNTGYCYLESSNGPNDTFTAYDADKDKYLVLGREEIKQLDLVKGKYENK
jgi:hypothetical protein|tara:strand:+ start:226 stop:492 length:267 start_codon:yes stop_codon:yes gene_type:complete